MTVQLPMDIRIASETARFGFVFSRRGIVMVAHLFALGFEGERRRPLRGRVLVRIGIDPQFPNFYEFAGSVLEFFILMVVWSHNTFWFRLYHKNLK